MYLPGVTEFLRLWRKNDGAAVPRQQACLLRVAEGALSFWATPSAQTLGLAPAFPQKKAPHSRAGLVGWVANGI